LVTDPYCRDPHRPTSRELERDLDRLTDAFVAGLLGDDLTPDDWPRMTDGRTHGEVSLEAAGVESGLPVELGDRPLLPKPPEGPLCVSCGLAPIRRKRDGLCDRCRKHLDLTGSLPGARANYFQARRLGIRATDRGDEQMSTVITVIDDRAQPTDAGERLAARRKWRDELTERVNAQVPDAYRESIQLAAEQGIALRVAYRVWCAPIIAADRKLTPEETEWREAWLAEMAEVDRILGDWAGSAIAAASQHFIDNPDAEPLDVAPVHSSTDRGNHGRDI
jgi:hypothetical protein